MVLNWPYDITVEEAVFQALHAVDMQQTLDIKHDHNARHYVVESENVIDGGWLIGSHPSDRRIYAYMGSEAVLHVAVTAALMRWAPPWAARVWEVTTVSVEGVTVAKNARIGLRLHF